MDVKEERTAFARSFNVCNICPGTCFPGIAVTLIRGCRFVLESAVPIIVWSSSPTVLCLFTSIIICCHTSSSNTLLKDSPGPGLDVKWDFACGVVMMGRSRRREDSTFWSKWSLLFVVVMDC